MNFSSIIKKNFIHNFNKYISFYFINSLIIALLFMYGSLMFNEAVLDSIGKTSIYETVNISLMGLIIFSIVFITYTNMAFLKNRGKEFGMYLTLGMTTKDLTKLIFIENLGIMLASLLTGVLTGTVFGKLFYMILNKIIASTSIPFKLNYKTYLLSIGVFSLIFIGNFIFNIFYIRKASIIEVIKASKKKEVGKANVLLGGISLILLIIAMIYLPKTLLMEIFKEERYMVGVFIAVTLICPYM
ncbi:FtsX-like permease family protein, partial [Clostridium tarantellae]